MIYRKTITKIMMVKMGDSDDGYSNAYNNYVIYKP